MVDVGFRGKTKPGTPDRDHAVRKLRIGPDPGLDVLAAECGRLYSQSLVWFWRVARRKGIWLSEPALRELSIKNGAGSDALHSSTQQACVSAFIDALHTWRSNRAVDPSARPPHRRKRFFRIVWIHNAIRVEPAVGGGVDLVLSNGLGPARLDAAGRPVLTKGGKPSRRLNPPTRVPWRAEWGVPARVEAGWTGAGYELRATYRADLADLGPAAAAGRGRTAAVDLGEVHPAVIAVAAAAETDPLDVAVFNGRLLRSKRQYRNKTYARLQERISRTKPGSRRRRRLVASKRKQMRRINHQIRDIEHKLTTAAVERASAAGVDTLVVGDLRDIRRTSAIATAGNTRRTANAKQKIHQAPTGRVRRYLTYKARRLGIATVIWPEHYTSQECLRCGHRTKTSNRRHVCGRCGSVAHRDGLGATNLLRKYHRENGLDPPRGVVGAMAAPTGVRYTPHMRCAPPRSSPGHHTR